MKRFFIAATIAALTIPVGFTAPAQAWDIPDTFSLANRFDLAVSVDNSYGVYPLTVSAKATCADGSMSILAPSDDPLVIAVGDSRGMVPRCLLNNGDTATYELTVSANGITARCNGTVVNHTLSGIEVTEVGDPACTWFNGDGVFFNFFQQAGTVAGDQRFPINISINPTYFRGNCACYPFHLGTEPLTGVGAATNVNTADTRSKNTGYVTLQPNRVTAMAKRFVDEPNSPINIHAYGPNRQTALARAEHVRDHLISEITRLGGDPSTYPTFVVYAGDPDHKKGVHVTIHQHDASPIAIR